MASKLFKCSKCGSTNVTPYDKNDKPIRSKVGQLLHMDDMVKFVCNDCGEEMEHAEAADQTSSINIKYVGRESKIDISGSLNKGKEK